jgi:crossover junction endodeoxyribonuclease RusA
MMYEFSLPWPPSVLNPNTKAHWSVKAKAAKIQKEACYYTVKSVLKGAAVIFPDEGKVGIQMTFHPPQNRSYDEDNLISRAKSTLDGVALGLGIDDKRFKLGEPIIGNVVKGGEIKISLCID